MVLPLYELDIVVLVIIHEGGAIDPARFWLGNQLINVTTAHEFKAIGRDGMHLGLGKDGGRRQKDSGD